MLTQALVGHFVADFVFQPRWMGKRKSSEPLVLLLHCLIVFAVVAAATLSPVLALYNAVAHLAVDAFIWNGYKFLRRKESPATFQYWDDSLFYTFIGFDQLLHQLFILWIFQ